MGGPLAYDPAPSNGLSWQIKLTYRLKNLGKTPAVDVSLFAHMLPMVSGKDGIVLSEELDKACEFPEKMQVLGFSLGEMIFPQEEWPEKTFLVSGVKEIFDRAKKVDPLQKYFGQFLVAPCVTYKPTFSSQAPFRTAKEYFITKRNGTPIDLEGEALASSDLYFTPSTHGSLAK